MIIMMPTQNVGSEKPRIDVAITDFEMKLSGFSPA